MGSAGWETGLSRKKKAGMLSLPGLPRGTLLTQDSEIWR
jgi:hypothetical protein